MRAQIFIRVKRQYEAGVNKLKKSTKSIGFFFKRAVIPEALVIKFKTTAKLFWSGFVHLWENSSGYHLRLYTHGSPLGQPILYIHVMVFRLA